MNKFTVLPPYALVPLLFASVVLVNGCVKIERPKPPPDPDDDDNPAATSAEAIVRQVFADYCERLADSAEEASTEAENDASASSVNKNLNDRNYEHWKEAFVPLDQYLEKQVGGKKWSSRKAQSTFSELNTAFRKVSKDIKSP
jgi:hypothetical protein